MERGETARGTLVYVHGAMDRAQQVTDHVALIRQGLAQQGMAFDVVASSWGEAVGARLDRIDLAIPMDTPMTLSAQPVQLQAVMDDGPLSELERLAATRGTEGAQHSATTVPIRDADGLLAIAAGGAMLTTPRLDGAGRRGALVVATSDEYARARGADVPEVELVAATARAVAASAAADTEGIPETAADSPQSLDVATTIELRIAEAVLVVAAATLLAGYVGVDVGPGLKRWATDTVLPHRSRLMHERFLGTADVLRYLRNGTAIREFVAGTIRDVVRLGRPVVALGNSLGGIVLVETLAATDGPRPDLLVTVGSQAPLLMTIDALPEVAAGQPFQPWLNMYDRRDLAAFTARQVWPDAAGIQDLAVDSGLGFPDSHGATYLTLPAVYQAIRDHPAIGSDRSDR